MKNSSNRKVVLRSDVSEAELRKINQTRNWSALVVYCQKEQAVDIASFQLLVQMYAKMRKQEEIPEAAYWIEDMIIQCNLRPKDLKSADNVRQWNEALASFWKVSHNKAAQDEEICQKLIFEWWRALAKKHSRSVNVFRMMEQTRLSEEPSVWKDVFPKELLLKYEYYGQLLKCGEIGCLLSAGKSDYVIANFAKLKVAGAEEQDKNRDAYVKYASQVTPQDMRAYLQNMHKKQNFHFFVMHPEGLKCLIDAGYFGRIALMAKEFKAIVRDFPKSFAACVEQTKYAAMLSYALDE